MIKTFINTLNKGIYAFWIIAALALFMQGKVPYMLPLSVASLLVVFLLLFSKKEQFSELITNIKTYFKLAWSYLLLVFLFVTVALLYFVNYSIVFKEAIYAIYIAFLIFILYLLNRRGEQVTKKIDILFAKGYLFFIFSLLLSFYYNFYSTGKWYGMSVGRTTDYNYLSLAFISGFIVLVYASANFKKLWQNGIVILGLFLLIVPILVSGSRRGIILLLIVNSLFFVYLIIGYIKKKTHRGGAYYLLTMLLFIGLFVIVFQTNSSAWRSYFVDTYFNAKAIKIKRQYTDVMYRYSSIVSDSVDYQEVYNKYWKPELYKANGVFENFIFENKKQEFSKLFSTGEYATAYDRFLHTAYFSSSKEKLIEAMPDSYNLIANELSDSIKFEHAAYKFNIPYSEANFFSFTSVSGLQLTTNKFPLKFIFQHENPSILNYILILPKSKYRISFDYGGIEPENLQIHLWNRNNRNIKLYIIIQIH